MIKKLIYLFCGTLVLTACGNSIEKKANEKLVIAKAAYERGDYEEAKSQIDSIKILYPKAFEARKAGQELMLDVAPRLAPSCEPKNIEFLLDSDMYLWILSI